VILNYNGPITLMLREFTDWTSSSKIDSDKHIGVSANSVFVSPM